MSDKQCPVCHGTKHIIENGKVRRCRCYYLEKYADKLSKANLSVADLDSLLDSHGLPKFPSDSEGLMAEKFISLVQVEKRASNKKIFLDVSRGQARVRRLLALLLLHTKTSEYLKLDLSELIDGKFKNESISLKQVNIITDLYTVAKSLRQKFIKSLSLQAQLEGKLLIFVVPSYQAFKQENTELGAFISDAETLVIPKIV